MPYQLTIIGPGRVGTAIGLVFKNNKSCCIKQIFVQDLLRGATTKQLLNAEQCLNDINLIQPCDIILITTPDDLIQSVVQQLSKIELKPNTLVFHCSGQISSEALMPLKKQNMLIASCHPLFSFSNSNYPVDSFEGIPCAIEGDEQAVRILDQLLLKVKAETIPIRSQDKTKWHLAAVLACNGLNALFSSTLSLYEEIGLKERHALDVLTPIITQTIEQILRFGPTQSLTGPIERGDVKTIKNHLKTISNVTPHHKALYLALSHELVKISGAKGNACRKNLEKIQGNLDTYID